ncbi:MAG: NAD(P)H-hydrate dehydratase [Gammaproteobacteria bacterium]|nr:NAD(P)H-hydrate dehydratase [Gammaproteobacteria bacterium]
MSQLPPNLFSAQQVRELDQCAIEKHNIPGATLMERAGEAAFNVLRQSWPQAQKILLLCGTGNNGGDGYVIARLARQQGLVVSLYQIGDADRLKGDAKLMAERLAETDVVAQTGECPNCRCFDVIVDAMLGTGLHGEVSDHYRQIIEQVNASGTPALAVDTPSGLSADTGAVLGVAIKAEQTITFIGMKQGLLTGDGPEYCGQLHFDDLQIPTAVYDGFEPSAVQLDYTDLIQHLAPRSRSSHKGQHGHVLVIGGEQGFTGALQLAGEAALRTGAGLVSLATRAAHASVINTDRTELMSHGIETAAQLKPLLAKASVIAVGPGLGQSDWAQALFNAALESELPLVVDADALNLLAADPRSQSNWILTPHPGEAARLLGQTSQQVQADRFAAAREIQSKYGGIVVLKGAGTLVQTESGPTGICPYGNPGMATGGMGDVLTGVIAGLCAQDLSLSKSAQLGVCVHSLAADDVVQKTGERGLLASDLMLPIRRRVNP